MRVTVKQARVGIEASQAEMAAKMGICLDTYRKLEQNPEKMTLAQAVLFSRITGMEPGDIFFFCESI